jgi:hypothetical protein
VLQRVYEQLIVEATLDPGFGRRLISDPYGAALEAGYSTLVAESLVGLRAGNLADFAAALHRRVYGATPAGAPGDRHALPWIPNSLSRPTGTSG